MRGLGERTPTTAKLCLAGLALYGVAAAGRAQEAGLPSAPQPVLAAQSRSFAIPRHQPAFAIEPLTQGVLSLTLDDAIDRALKHNFSLYLDQQDERNVRGQVLTVGSNLLPNLEIEARTSTQEINLAAMGFKPANLPKSLGSFRVSSIVKVDTTSAQLNLSQTLFNAQAYEFYRAAQGDVKVAGLNVLETRGNVVMTVGTEYLQALADAATIEDATEQLKADREVLRQATESHDAGVGLHLDVLRARVQTQTQELILVNAQNQFAKDKIALNRTLALPVNQEIAITDAAPFVEFEALPLEQAKALAATHRKDYLALLAQSEVALRTEKAIRYGRLPTLGVGGFYGVLGETRGLYHGVFSAQGRLSVPLFQEAALRGEREVAAARVSSLRLRTDDLLVTIDAQIRAAMLDVNSGRELVKVARSNVDLATQQLADTRDRYAAGVDDLLPVVQAQAALSSARNRVVATVFAYNRAKLSLALQTGVLESQYKSFLGR